MSMHAYTIDNLLNKNKTSLMVNPFSPSQLSTPNFSLHNTNKIVPTFGNDKMRFYQTKQTTEDQK